MNINKEVFKGIQAEILAGSVGLPKNQEDKAWNNACKRASNIVQHYIDGKGLFQKIEKRLKK